MDKLTTSTILAKAYGEVTVDDGLPVEIDDLVNLLMGVDTRDHDAVGEAMGLCDQTIARLECCSAA